MGLLDALEGLEIAMSQAQEATITACFPTQSFFHPGEAGGVHVTLAGRLPSRAILRVRVSELRRTVLAADAQLEGPDQEVSFPLPTTPGKGYGVDVSLVDASTGRALHRRRTALDVQASWTDAPRYGFLSEFSPGEQYDARADKLLARHVNVVQFYDWMYRHYQYLPPSDVFTDALGRTLALSSTQRAIAALHHRQIATMAYGSVYGAEPEYALQHPDELLYDESGKPISLSNLFYLQDVRPGPWRDHILGQYESAIQTLAFNGIHADQYGFPPEAWDAHENIVEMGPALASMVGASQAAVAGTGGDGIIFNCVTNWPIRDTAAEPQLCTYIEVWPPYITLGQLADLVNGAKDLAPLRQVILAAYMACASETPDRAETATLLTSAAIHASGGFHLLLGEGTGMLVDAYYPKFKRPGSHFQQRLVDHWSFIVHYGAYLFNRDLRHVEGDIQVHGPWPIHRACPTFETVSLINAHPDDLWDVLKKPPKLHRNVVVEAPSPSPPREVFVATPDGSPDAISVPFEHVAGKLRFVVPRVQTWSLAIIMRT